MNVLFRILSVIAAMAAGSAITMYVLNKKNDSGEIECGVLLAKNRKELINKMNKNIEDIEKRTSAENHAKMQRDLENMDWNSGACSY